MTAFFCLKESELRQKSWSVWKKHIVAIMLDRKYVKKTIGSVVFDSYQAGYEITKHLINLGHKGSAFWTRHQIFMIAPERKRGYQESPGGAWNLLYWRRIFFQGF